MKTYEELRSFGRYEWHKGFYNAEDSTDALCRIYFEDFMKYHEDEEFPYCTAHQLLRGSCHLFALGLEKVFGYAPYIVEGKDKRSFHTFCQIYKRGVWFYVDARGITTSYNEFMDVAKEFVSGEYTIRPISAADIEEFRREDIYYDIALDFAVAVIEKYKNYYTIDGEKSLK